MIQGTDHSTWCHSILEDLKTMLKEPIDAAKSSVAKLGRKLEGTLLNGNVKNVNKYAHVLLTYR